MKSGFVAVVGKANAGKSTLINVLVGEKVAIVSPKPQTTRDRILGVLTKKDYQIAFIDTPGIYRQGSLLNSTMQKTASDSAKDVDVILLVIDGHSGLAESDLKLIERFKKAGLPLVICLSKVDITTENLLISELKPLAELDVEVVPVSARRGKNLKELLKVLVSKFTIEEKIFSNDIVSDRGEKFMIAEIMREKILLKCEKEIPHGVAIIINTFKYLDEKDMYEISLDVICEKQNHKAILIGKGGNKIKEISSFARQDMEKFLDKKVFLTTYVKVEEDWRNSARLLKEYGYKKEGFSE